MNIVINPKNLVPNDTWQYFRKVRAIIENENGEYAITEEGGKAIFPGGKCDIGESDEMAIQREIKEETSILLDISDFHYVLTLETFYEDAIDYRTNMVRPRYTLTKFYYVKTNKIIDKDKMELTDDEVKENFNISFVNKEELYKIILSDHSYAMNGNIFDEENRVVMDNILKK